MGLVRGNIGQRGSNGHEEGLRLVGSGRKLDRETGVRLTGGGGGRDGVELRVGRASRVGLHDRPCGLCVVAL